MGVDDYVLCRDYRGSVRLEAQHHLWSELFGYHLNPAIPTAAPDLAIADLGTGTGVWLLDLDRRLSNPASRLCGLDISSDQFPRPEWLPPNAQFFECDAFDPAGPPAHLAGAFDIVHIRLFIAVVKNNDPTSILNFCYRLLKPGGYLQWDELEPSRARARSHNGSPTEGMEMIARLARTQKPTDWAAKLPQTFEESGFRVMEVDQRMPLPWQRGSLVDLYCMLADEFVERADRGGDGINPVDDFYRQLPAKASAEKRLGSYVELTSQIVVGRKT
ncbi:S-adenosyl-L-methionine-dependent methyltransferase [Usnea florida]